MNMGARHSTWPVRRLLWWALAVACYAALGCDSFLLPPSPTLWSSKRQVKYDYHYSPSNSLLFVKQDDTNRDEGNTSARKEDETTTVDDEQEEEDLPWFPPLSTDTKQWKLVAAYLGFISFWPLLALLQIYLRNHEFDINTYLTVKGLLDSAAPSSYDDYDSSIMELPPLSPAERLVDSLFGPPGVDRRGF